MRGAFGKPTGMVARVDVNQIVLSCRTKTANRQHVIEAFRRAKMKFPGSQATFVSSKVGFTDLTPEEFSKLKAEGRIVPDGCIVRRIPDHGKLRKYEDPAKLWLAAASRKAEQEVVEEVAPAEGDKAKEGEKGKEGEKKEEKKDDKKDEKKDDKKDAKKDEKKDDKKDAKKDEKKK
jgi:hypothetical protein